MYVGKEADEQVLIEALEKAQDEIDSDNTEYAFFLLHSVYRQLNENGHDLHGDLILDVEAAESCCNDGQGGPVPKFHIEEAIEQLRTEGESAGVTNDAQ